MSSKLEYILATGLSLSWAVVVWALVIGKLVTSGVGNYIIHYTNWSWTLSGLFFILDGVGACFSATGFIVDVITYLFWFANGTAWMVFWLMFIVLRDNPELILQESTQFGGKYALGFVFDMERLFHVLPAFVLVFYGFLRRTYIRASIRKVYGHNGVPLWMRVVYGIVIMLCAPILAILYFLMLSVKTVYGVDASPWIFVGVGIGALLIFNVVPFLVFINQVRQRLKRNKSKV